VISHPLHIPCHVREHILCQENTFFEGSVISHSLLLQHHGCFLKNLRQKATSLGRRRKKRRRGGGGRGGGGGGGGKFIPPSSIWPGRLS